MVACGARLALVQIDDGQLAEYSVWREASGESAIHETADGLPVCESTANLACRCMPVHNLQKPVVFARETVGSVQLEPPALSDGGLEEEDDFHRLGFKVVLLLFDIYLPCADNTTSIRHLLMYIIFSILDLTHVGIIANITTMEKGVCPNGYVFLA